MGILRGLERLGWRGRGRWRSGACKLRVTGHAAAAAVSSFCSPSHQPRAHTLALAEPGQRYPAWPAQAGEGARQPAPWLQALVLACAAAEFDEVPVRHNEEKVNAALAQDVRWGLPIDQGMDDPHAKANLLLQVELHLPGPEASADASPGMSSGVCPWSWAWTGPRPQTKVLLLLQVQSGAAEPPDISACPVCLGLANCCACCLQCLAKCCACCRTS